MSICTRWATRTVIECKNWAQKLDYVCTQWADEGSYQCSEYAEETRKTCDEWGKKCKWYTPWNCVIKWVCLGWSYVVEYVCKAWYWVAKWVCKAFAFIVKVVCVLWSWVTTLVCLAWEIVWCSVTWIVGVVSGLFRGPRKRRIEHVFVLMLENRSFDHMLGASAIRGVGIDGNPTSIDVAGPTDTNVNPVNGIATAVSPPADFALKGIDEDPGHDFDNTLRQLCGANTDWDTVKPVYPQPDNSGFIADYLGRGANLPERVMACFSEEQLPVLNTLAREFAVCDAWFASLPGPTWPNRFFAMAATSGGLDDSPSIAEVILTSTIDGYRFEKGNIFDKLDDHCIEWKVYESDEFPVAFALSGMNINRLQDRYSDFEDLAPDLASVSFGPRFVFIEPKYGADSVGITGPGDYTCGNSMHPLDDVTRGEKLIKDVYDAIRQSPHWDKSLLIVTFDEHGGFYDHRPPPGAVPPGDLVTQAYVKKGFPFDRLGPRVPAVIVSPWIRRGVIDHTTYDHTSILATVERLLGLSNLTNRDRAANDLLHLLTLDTPRTDAPTAMPSPAVNPNPLGCEGDSEDVLLKRRAELREAQRTGRFRERRTADVPATSTQIGFAQVALMRVLLTAKYPERERWIDQYKAIQTGVDASLFMTEAKLQISHDIDFKRPRATDRPGRGRK